MEMNLWTKREVERNPNYPGLILRENRTFDIGRSYSDYKETKHDFALMDMAIREALCSTACKGMVGLVAAVDSRPIMGAYNGTLPGASNICENEAGKTKRGVLHAEHNLLARASKHGISLQGASIYVTRRPCEGCLPLLISCEVSKIFYIEDKQDHRDDHLMDAVSSGILVYKMNPYVDRETESGRMKVYLWEELKREQEHRRNLLSVKAGN